jgi:hypothetical protein
VVGEIQPAILIVVVYLFVLVFGVEVGEGRPFRGWFLGLALFNMLAHQLYFY